MMPASLVSTLLLTFLGTFAAYGETSLGRSVSTEPEAESAYLASRDATIARVKKRDAAGGETTDAQTKQDTRALRDLESKLRRMMTPISVDGFSGLGDINLETFSSGDIGFGALDALVFHAPSGKDNLFVTTEGLLARWLKQHQTWWDNEPPLPQSALLASRREAFFTQAVSADAAIYLYGTVPTNTPPDATFALAQLEATSQDQPPALPDELVVSLSKGGKFLIFVGALKVPFVLPSACKGIRSDYDRKVQKLTARQAAGTQPSGSDKRDPNKIVDDLERLQKEASDASLLCFKAHAKAQPAFGAAADQARAFLNAASRK